MCNVMLIEENYKYMYKDAQKRNKEILKNVNNKTFRGHWDLVGFFWGGCTFSSMVIYNLEKDEYILKINCMKMTRM